MALLEGYRSPARQAAKAAGSSWIPSGYAVGSYYPIQGADRYETSFKVAKYFFGGTNGAGLATGTNWADALSGGALMGSHYAPVLLVSPAAWTAFVRGQG